MVKKISFVLILSLCCYALDAKTAALNLTGNANRAKIESIFNDGSYIDEYGRINYTKIVNILRSNSLMTLNYSQPFHMNVLFEANSSPMLTLKIINQILSDLGYSYILTKSLTISGSHMFWSIELNTQSLLNPATLYEEFKKNRIYLQQVKRTGQFDYVYVLDTGNAIINAKTYQSNSTYSLSKPLTPYFLNIYKKNKIVISANNGDSWIALVKIFDRNLQLLKQIKSTKPEKRLTIELPPNAFYMVIDDVFSLENIKRGLKIYIE